MAKPVEVTIGGTTFELELLGLDGECQQHTYWCWAAVAVEIANYYEGPKVWTQCSLVERVIGDCCSEPDVECPTTLSDAGACDRVFPTGCALCATGRTTTPYGSQNLPFATVRQEIAGDRPVACAIGTNHAVTIYGCAWAKEDESESYVCLQNPYDSEPGVKPYRELDASCFWLSTPPGTVNSRDPTGDEIATFINNISTIRPRHQQGRSLEVFKLNARGVFAPEPLKAATVARRYVLESGTVWRDVPLIDGREMFSKSSSVSGSVLSRRLAARPGQIPAVEAAGEADSAIVEIPTVCTRALWRGRQDDYIPLGRIPYFLGEGSPLPAAVFWDAVRKHVRIALDQTDALDFPCGNDGGCGDCPAVKKKAISRRRNREAEDASGKR